MAPLANAGKGLLWDWSGLLITNFVTMFSTWYFYTKTVITPPGYMDDTMPDVGKWRQLYEDTLEALADESTALGEQKQERLFVSIFRIHSCDTTKTRMNISIVSSIPNYL